MPLYDFKCENSHIKEVYRPKPYKNKVRIRCSECGLWMYRVYGKSQPLKHIRLDYEKDPISHLVKKDGFKGLVIEHGTHRPRLIKTREEYRRFLQETNSVEKRTGIGGKDV